MAKKISISVKDPDNLEFYLENDGDKGDFICLNDVNEISFNELKKEIDLRKDNYINKIYKEKLPFLEKDWESKYKKSKSYTDILENSNNYEAYITHKVAIEKNIASESIEKFKKEIDYDGLKKSKEENKVALELIKLKTISEFKSSNEFKKIEDEAKESAEDKYSPLIKDKKEEIEKLKNDIKIFERKADNLNTKSYGENLENWIESEYYNNFVDSSENIKFYKETKHIDRTMPDFIFEVLDKKGSKLTRVIIEAKAEFPNSKEKKRNKDHYQKLWKDTKSRDGDYSILISELEKNKNFLIYKVQEKQYQNMFVIRPEYFIPFLKLINNFASGKNKIINQNIQFEERQKILRDFEQLKENIIKKIFIEKMKKKIDSIMKSSEIIKNANKKIIDLSSAIIEDHIEEAEKQIEKFTIKIQNISKKIDG